MESLPRDLANYFPLTYECFRADRRSIVTVHEILTSFRLSETRVDLAFDGWEQADDFNRKIDPSPEYRFAFSGTADSSLDYLKSEIIGFLTSEPAGEWTVEVFLIDMQIKQITLQIRHKNISNKLISQQIETEEEFDSLIAARPQIVGAVEQFAWGYAKAHSEVLAKFN